MNGKQGMQGSGLKLPLPLLLPGLNMVAYLAL